MNITECSPQLSELADKHANYQISFESYRAQRKLLLDSLDKQYNGVTATASVVLPEPAMEEEETLDKTQPYLASKIGKCINFLKRN
ncbi:hypothetical protein CW745_01210 [Psychromonas sp. psych-6C06]|uniref:hypothetical protein n=1 Tax=Psychromonas sp. psych-6C06 TaxID=2058089 RepID=UPI000C34EE6A|nr:hypothetical protein [Psychromonas sp. psych-6C06]PKF63498.1 hypothetical protein CW745_01210 [Psychromonas sp. psych-6C06]